MTDHYYSVSSNDGDSTQVMPIKVRAERAPINFLSDDDTHYNSCISIKELRYALSQCRNMAPGLDGIYYEMLRYLSDTANDSYWGYITRYEQKRFSHAWGKAVLLSFLKKEKPSAEAASYRPIALTSCVCKLLERIVNNRLQYMLEKRDLLSQRLYEFRKMRGTEDAHVLLQTAMLNAFTLKQ